MKGSAEMEYRIVEGRENMALEDIVRLLRFTYWADKRPVEIIEKSLGSSSCYGVYLEEDARLAGFARVISDYATTFYLCDVVVDPAYRRRGLGSALVSHIVSLPVYAGLRGFLVTRDAHGLYEKFGFKSADGRAMVRQEQRLRVGSSPRSL